MLSIITYGYHYIMHLFIYYINYLEYLAHKKDVFIYYLCKTHFIYI